LRLSGRAWRRSLSISSARWPRRWFGPWLILGDSHAGASERCGEEDPDGVVQHVLRD
jgi:hypothetical protein